MNPFNGHEHAMSFFFHLFLTRRKSNRNIHQNVIKTTAKWRDSR